MLSRWIFTICFWSYFAISCVVFYCIAVLIRVLTLPFDRNGKLLHLYSCFWGAQYYYMSPFWRFTVENRHYIPWNKAAVLVSNHGSLGDILVLFGLYRPFKWVSKASVFKVPFLGWNMSLNRYVGLKRGDRESIAKMMSECEEWLDRGVPILLFPEGTRSEDGNIKPFKDGAFRLSLNKQCPIIPIVVIGTERTLPKHGFLLQVKAECIVRVLPPVDPTPFNGDLAALREHVRDIIIKERQKILEERAKAGIE
jgi:1-acyl-sn-glycerol-3-phosphate acyltransferase